MIEKVGYVQQGLSLHTSVKDKLNQDAKECGVSKSEFVSRLIETYGPALKKKLLGKT